MPSDSVLGRKLGANSVSPLITLGTTTLVRLRKDEPSWGMGHSNSFTILGFTFGIVFSEENQENRLRATELE